MRPHHPMRDPALSESERGRWLVGALDLLRHAHGTQWWDFQSACIRERRVLTQDQQDAESRFIAAMPLKTRADRVAVFHLLHLAGLDTNPDDTIRPGSIYWSGWEPRPAVLKRLERIRRACWAIGGGKDALWEDRAAGEREARARSKRK